MLTDALGLVCAGQLPLHLSRFCFLHLSKLPLVPSDVVTVLKFLWVSISFFIVIRSYSLSFRWRKCHQSQRSLIDLRERLFATVRCRVVVGRFVRTGRCSSEYASGSFVARTRPGVYKSPFLWIRFDTFLLINNRRRTARISKQFLRVLLSRHFSLMFQRMSILFEHLSHLLLCHGQSSSPVPFTCWP